MTAKAESCRLGYFGLSKCPPARGLSRVPPTLTQRARLAMLRCRQGPHITGSLGIRTCSQPFQGTPVGPLVCQPANQDRPPGLHLSRAESGRAGLDDSLPFPRGCGEVRLPCLREGEGGLPASGAKSLPSLSGHPLSSKEKSSGVRQAL